MSEKIYRLLLRLYPSRFREAYGELALQLFRDRARDERGYLQKLRLWLDLLIDVAVSLPREYWRSRAVATVASVLTSHEDMPSFQMLCNELPGAGSLVLGAIASLILGIALSIAAGRVKAISLYRVAGNFQNPAQLPPRPNPRAPVEPADSALPAVVEGDALASTEKHHVIDMVIANLKQHYVDPAIAEKMADSLSREDAAGGFTDAGNGAAFANLLTKRLREISGDAHLIVVYNEAPSLPNRPREDASKALAEYQAAMKRQNCTFEKVATLPYNIGYLKLNSFPDPSICEATATAALNSLNHTDAIIFDLRDNRGGFPRMVAMIAGWLFDHPEYWYNPRENTTRESWTRSPVPGSSLAHKPVFLLTSSTTISGAEQFAWNLKMLKRATIVGERTAGSAHSGVYYRIDAHFGMGIPEVKPINPFADSDWEGAGVEPDVQVRAGEALDRAEILAETALKKR